MAPMFCPSCGKQLIVTGQRFCAYCAADLSILAAGPRPAPSSPPAAASPPVSATPRLEAAGIKPGPAASPQFVPGTLAPWARGEEPSSLAGTVNEVAQPLAGETAARRQGPSSIAGAPTTATPQDLLIAAGCSAGALVATALPWANRILAPSLAGLQFVFPLIPPLAALVVCWMLHSNMPESLSTGRMWGLRISFVIGIAAAVVVLIAFGQTQTSYGYSYSVSDVAQPAIGLWLYLLACGAGLVFSFRIPKADGLA